MDTTTMIKKKKKNVFVFKPWLSYKWTWKFSENIRSVGGGEIITDI